MTIVETYEILDENWNIWNLQWIEFGSVSWLNSVSHVKLSDV